MEKKVLLTQITFPVINKLKDQWCMEKPCSPFLSRLLHQVICEDLGVEPLLLCMERSQLRWFGHLERMPTGHLPMEVSLARPAGKRPPDRPRFRWRDYISALAWEVWWWMDGWIKLICPLCELASLHLLCSSLVVISLGHFSSNLVFMLQCNSSTF